MTTLVDQEYEILDTTFELDTLVDIVNHGMSSGVGGFIYTSALVTTFDLHEDEIMSYLNEWHEDNFGKCYINYRSECINFDSLTDLKSDAVWLYVECKAYDILMQELHPSVY